GSAVANSRSALFLYAFLRPDGLWLWLADSRVINVGHSCDPPRPGTVSVSHSHGVLRAASSFFLFNLFLSA
ncbi:hypothetical protein BDW72DRAFT_168152, partial [Aspergillus terricola var. indicus]